MPIHDFRCLQCGKVSEVFVRGGEQTTCCPDCGSTDLERLLSSSYVIKIDGQAPGTTCCGQAERCDTPPCSSAGSCRCH